MGKNGGRVQSVQNPGFSMVMVNQGWMDACHNQDAVMKYVYMQLNILLMWEQVDMMGSNVVMVQL